MEDISIKLYNRKRQQIATLFEVINPIYTEVYNGINTLKFDIPFYIEEGFGSYENITNPPSYLIEHQGEWFGQCKMVKNPHVEMLKPFYLLKHKDEWFVIVKPDKTSQENESKMTITAKSLAYELRNKWVRQFEIQSGTDYDEVLNLSGTVGKLLQGTQWSIGTVATSLNLKYRALQISKKTLLDVIINDICDKWDCVVKFNTSDKTISFVEFVNDSFDTGLQFTEARYLTDIDMQYNEDSIVTKLKVFGKNGISINAVNPSGQNYILDFTYFIQNGYLSPTLSDKLNDYSTDLEALNIPNTEYSNLLQSISTKEAQLATLENELKELYVHNTTGLYAIQKLIEITQSTNGDITALQTQETDKLTEIGAKNTLISNKKQEILDLKQDVSDIVDEYAFDNYFTSGELDELSDYIIEAEYEDTAITEKGDTLDVLKELMTEAVNQLKAKNQPKYSATINVVDFTQSEDTEFDADRLKLGCSCRVKHQETGINFLCRVIEIEHSYHDFGLKIKIANEKSIKDGLFTIAEILKEVSNTSNIINLNIEKWALGDTANNIIKGFLDSSRVETKQQLLAGYNDGVVIDKRGITLTDPTNENYVQRFNSHAWGLSTDGGRTFKIGASNGVIHAESIAGDVVIGQQGLFNNIKVFNQSDNADDPSIIIGDYSIGAVVKRGIKIKAGSLDIVGDYSPTLSYNNVSIDNTNGVVVTGKYNGIDKIKTYMNGTDGFKIEQFSNNTWNKIFGFNSDFTSLEFNGVVKAKDFYINGISVLDGIEGSKKIKGTAIEGTGLILKTTSGTPIMTVTDTKVTFGSNVELDWSNVASKPTFSSVATSGSYSDLSNKPSIPSLPPYITSTKIDKASIESPTITGGTIETLSSTNNRIKMSDTWLKFFPHNDATTPKLAIGFDSTTDTIEPKIIIGAGDENGRNRMTIYKDTTGLGMVYDTTKLNSHQAIYFRDSDYCSSMYSSNDVRYNGCIQFNSATVVDFSNAKVTGLTSVTATLVLA